MKFFVIHIKESPIFADVLKLLQKGMQLAMKEIDSILDRVNIIEEKLQCKIIEAYYDELVDDFCLKMEFLKDGSKIKSWKRYDVHTLKNIVFPQVA